MSKQPAAQKKRVSSKAGSPQNKTTQHVDTSAWVKANQVQVLASEIRAASSYTGEWTTQREHLVDYFSGLGDVDEESFDDFGCALGGGLIGTITSQRFNAAQAIIRDRTASMNDIERANFLAGSGANVNDSALQKQADKLVAEGFFKLNMVNTARLAAGQHLLFTPTTEGVDPDGSFAGHGGLISDEAMSDFDLEVTALEILASRRASVLGEGGARLVVSDDRSTEALAAEIGRWRVERARKWLRAPKEDTRQGSLLFSLLTHQSVGKAVLAEAFARLDLYVLSGHAAKDFDPTQPLPITENQRAAVKFMRELARNYDSTGLPPAESEIQALGQCLSMRMEDLFLCMKMNNKGVVSQMKEEGKSSFNFFENKAQGSGIVDLVVRDATHPSKLHVGVVTSLVDTKKQADQISKHVGGIKLGIKAQAAGYLDGDELGKVLFYSDALFPVDYLKTKFSRNFVQSVEAGRGRKFEKQELELLLDNANLLLLFRGLNHVSGERDPDHIMKARHFRTGAPNRPFDETLDGLENAIMAAKDIASMLEVTSSAFPSLRIANENGTAPIIGGRIFMEALSDAFCGMMKEYGSYDIEDKELEEQKKSACAQINETFAEQQENLLKILAHCCAQKFCVKEAEAMCAAIGVFSDKRKLISGSDGLKYVQGHKELFTKAYQDEKSRKNRVEIVERMVHDMASSAPTKATMEAYVVNCRVIMTEAAGRFGDEAVKALRGSIAIDLMGKCWEKDLKMMIETCPSEEAFVEMMSTCFPKPPASSKSRARIK